MHQVEQQCHHRWGLHVVDLIPVIRHKTNLPGKFATMGKQTYKGESALQYQFVVFLAFRKNLNFAGGTSNFTRVTKTILILNPLIVCKIKICQRRNKPNISGETMHNFPKIQFLGVLFRNRYTLFLRVYFLNCFNFALENVTFYMI